MIKAECLQDLRDQLDRRDPQLGIERGGPERGPHTEADNKALPRVLREQERQVRNELCFGSQYGHAHPVDPKPPTLTGSKRSDRPLDAFLVEEDGAVLGGAGHAINLVLDGLEERVPTVDGGVADEHDDWSGDPGEAPCRHALRFEPKEKCAQANIDQSQSQDCVCAAERRNQPKTGEQRPQQASNRVRGIEPAHRRACVGWFSHNKSRNREYHPEEQRQGQHQHDG